MIPEDKRHILSLQFYGRAAFTLLGLLYLGSFHIVDANNFRGTAAAIEDRGAQNLETGPSGCLGSPPCRRDRKAKIKKRIDHSYRRQITEEEFVGTDGLPIRYKQYRYLGHEQAFVVFLNGQTEYIEKYDPLFTSLV